MHEQLRDLVRPIRRGLGTLRRRVRSLLVVLGVSRSVAVLAAAILVFFVLDYTLRLPLWVRGCLLGATIATTGVVVWRRLLGPLSRPLTDEVLAGRVEAAHPDLEDRLRSSLAFAEVTGDDPDNEDSPELMRSVIQQTVERTRALRFADVAKGDAPMRWATIAAALAGVIVLGSIARAELASTFVQRSLLLQDVAWPRRTTLVVVDMEPGTPRAVTRGRETTIVIRAEGSVPDRVEFRYWEAGADRSSGERVELTPAAEDWSRFAITLPVYTSYEFTVRGGDDDREPVYRIEALTPPAIETLEIDVTYPAYLNKQPETLLGGDQRIPQGSKLRLRLRSTIPLAQAFMTFGAKEPVAMTAKSDRDFEIEREANADTRFSIRLVGKSGEENDPGADTYMLRVLKDQAPSVRIYTPSARTARMPGGVAFLGFAARDDYRISKVVFELKIDRGGKEAGKIRAEAEDLDQLPSGDGWRFLLTPGLEQDQMRGVVALDLSQLRTEKGDAVKEQDRIEYRFHVIDSAGAETSTRTAFVVDVVTDVTLGQELDSDRSELRAAVQEALENLDAARQGTKGIRDEIGDVTSLRRAAGRAQTRQARLIDDLDSVSRRARRLFNQYLFNRLDDPSAAQQILPYFERHLLQATRTVGAAYRGSLYRLIRTAVEDRQVRVGEAYDKLIRIADLADRLANDHGPAAYRALGQISKDPRRDPSASLDAAAEQHVMLSDGLSQLLRWMQQWQNYEEFVRGIRGLRDAQERVVNQLKDLDEED